MSKCTILCLFIYFSLLFLYLVSEEYREKEQQKQISVSNKYDIDTASFYWNAKDIRDISKLKSKYTSVVVADSFTYKAWSIDIQKYVAPFDTLDWCKMEILSYHKKR